MGRRWLLSIAVVALTGQTLIATSGASTVEAASATSAYTPITPTRILDTREGQGASRPGNGGTFTLDLDDVAGSPDNVSAVVLNVTVTNASGPGFVTVWPAGTPRPTTSAINYERAGQTIANLVTVPVSSDGRIAVYTLLAVDVVADVQGFYVPASSAAAGRLTTVVPTRVLDTREPNPVRSGALRAGDSVTIDFTSRGVAADATAAVLKVTVTEAAGAGYWTAHAAGGPRPLASNVNVDAVGQTIPNQVITPLANGRATIFSQTGGQLVVDLVGWFTGASAPASGDGLFVPVAPFRLVDTRDPGNGPGVQPRATNKIEVHVANRAGVPASGVAAVVVNATATETIAPGFFSVWPSRTYRPNISSLNASAAGQTIANHVITPVTGVGFDMYTMAGSHLLADVTGWFTGAPAAAELPPAVPLPGPNGPPEAGTYFYEVALRSNGSSAQTVRGDEWSPARWNPCRPIRWALNPNTYEAYRRVVVEAVDRIAAATGLPFVYVGDTTFVPYPHQGTGPTPTLDPDFGLTAAQIASRSGAHDLLISLGNPSLSDFLGGSTAGVAPFQYTNNGRQIEIFPASVIVDVPQHVSPSIGSPQPDWSALGLGNTLLHELAHAVGLDHVDVNTEIMQAAPDENSAAVLGPGDLRGLWQVGAARGCAGF